MIPQSLQRIEPGRRPIAFAVRRGFTVVELLSALVLIGVVFTVSISLLLAVAHERRFAQQRQFAMQHAANLLERSTARGWAGLADGPQPIEPAHADLTDLLPELDRRIDVTSTSEDFDARRVTVSIRWKNRTGQFVAPIRLTAWVYPPEVRQ